MNPLKINRKEFRKGMSILINQGFTKDQAFNKMKIKCKIGVAKFFINKGGFHEKNNSSEVEA
jgi:hypothetical protein